MRDQALSVSDRVLRRLFNRDFSREARFLWCKPLLAAASILEVASRYACAAPSLSALEMKRRNFLIDERNADRCPMFCSLRLSFCLARLRACGEFAKISPAMCLNVVALKSGQNGGDRNIGNFALKVNHERQVSALHCRAEFSH